MALLHPNQRGALDELIQTYKTIRDYEKHVQSVNEQRARLVMREQQRGQLSPLTTYTEDEIRTQQAGIAGNMYQDLFNLCVGMPEVMRWHDFLDPAIR